MKKYFFPLIGYIFIFVCAFMTIFWFDQHVDSDRIAPLSVTYDRDREGYVTFLDSTNAQSIVVSDGNQFDVLQDGNLLYSTDEENRFRETLNKGHQ